MYEREKISSSIQRKRALTLGADIIGLAQGNAPYKVLTVQIQVKWNSMAVWNVDSIEFSKLIIKIHYRIERE